MDFRNDVNPKLQSSYIPEKLGINDEVPLKTFEAPAQFL